MSRTVIVTPSWRINIWNGIARLSESLASALALIGRDVIVITPTISETGRMGRNSATFTLLEVADFPKGSWKEEAAQVINTLRGIDEIFVVDSGAYHAVKHLKGKYPIIGIALFGQSIQGERIPNAKKDKLIEDEDEFIRDADRLFVNNEMLRQRLQLAFDRQDIEKLEMVASVSPSIDYLLDTGVEKKKGSIVVVGKISPELGVEKVVRAMVDLPWLTLNIIGMPRSDIELNRLTYLTQYLGVSDRIIFHGWAKTKDVLKAIQSAEILVAPNHAEFFGYSAMDAMLMETPVIASATNVHLEIIDDESTGLLFHNLEQLKDALNQMHVSKELRDMYVEKALVKIKEERPLTLMADSLAAVIGV